MCTIGGLGRHIGPQSTDISVDYRSAIDRLSVVNRPTVDRQSTDMCTFIGRLSADISVHCRPIYQSTIDRQIGRLSTDSRSTVDRQSTDYKCYKYKCAYIGRQSTDISADVSADMSTEATYSTHDPENQQPPLAEGHSYIILWQMKVKIKSIYE